MHIVVIGMGYVGIPCAALFADVPGFRVTGLQRRSPRSAWKIDCLNRGQSPFQGDEPGLAELIQRVVLEKRTFHVTDDMAACADADVFLIDVQTPVDGNHVPQYESLCEVAADVGRHMKPGTLVIIESTVAPGTTEHVVLPILEAASGLKAGGGISNFQFPISKFCLAFSYERVMPGKLLEFLIHLPRVVGGIDEESTRRAVELYRHIVQAEITPTDCLTAEVAKTVENAYRDVNIAFANEMALACESLGVDIFEVRRLVNKRPDRHMHIPGAGVGGHCLPKDPWLLLYGVQTYGTRDLEIRNSKFELIKLARRINDSMPLYMARLVEEALAEARQPLAGAQIAVLGVAYLENSDDTRNTPAAPLIRVLCQRGATVVVHDPYVRQADFEALRLSSPAPLPPSPPAPLPDPSSVSAFSAVESVRYTQDLAEALQGADCAVLVTKHRDYLGPELLQAAQTMRLRILVDGRGCLDRQACAQAGIAYHALGRRPRAGSG